MWIKGLNRTIKLIHWDPYWSLLFTVIILSVNFINNVFCIALHIACRNDNLPACQYLIETAGCNGNAVDAKGQVALFYALEGDSIETMEYLLSRGLNCNHQNNQGRRYFYLHTVYMSNIRLYNLDIRFIIVIQIMVFIKLHTIYCMKCQKTYRFVGCLWIV